MIDESGEDYLYPADFSCPLNFRMKPHRPSLLPASRPGTRGVRLTMRAVREAAGKTQLDVAAESQMDQADVSRLESREEFDDCQVSTLRRYVTALGGNLELVAAFGNKKIVLSGVESGTRAMTPAPNRIQRTTAAPRRSRRAGRR